MKRSLILPLCLCLLAIAGCASGAGGGGKVANVILFVPDGLRAAVVEPALAPTFAVVRDQGVNFANPHAMYPTFTTPNATAMATGHYLGDTGEFANTIYPGFSSAFGGATLTPFMEHDEVLREVNDHYEGNFLNEESLIAAARAAGYSTAAIGKLGPVALQDVTAYGSGQTVVIDDDTGNGGWPVPADVKTAIKAAGLSPTPPGSPRGKPNTAQQAYFVDVVAKVLLPRFKAAKKPFFIVFWSRDPDGTQHSQNDSPGQLTPGINGPTSLAAIKNADTSLAGLRAALKAQGLDGSTNIVVTADHGFATIAKDSKTSYAAKQSYTKLAQGQGPVPKNELPPGFLAIDLAHALGLPLFDPDSFKAPVKAGQYPRRGSGLIGKNKDAPDVIVAANGGSDLIYLPSDKAQKLARKIVAALLKQDYVSGLFVDDALGEIPGTLPLSAINLKGAAKLPAPSILVNFRSFDTGCGMPLRCGVSIADATLGTGQGMHGSFSRAETANFQAAIGPDFKRGYRSDAPSSNADVGRTIAQLLKLDIPAKGKLVGRVLTESLKGGPATVSAQIDTIRGPEADGIATELRLQRVGDTLYFDAAGFPGRTLGLAP